MVLRNGVEIARGPMSLIDTPWRGTRAYLLLAGTTDAPSVVRGRPARRWIEIPLEGVTGDAGAIQRAQVVVEPVAAARIYDLLQPGATLLMTDQPMLAPGAMSMPLLDSDSRGDTPP